MTRIQDHIAHLESLRDLKVGERVRVQGSGRAGTLEFKRQDGGWTVRWDEPLFGAERGRVATANLERL